MILPRLIPPAPEAISASPAVYVDYFRVHIDPLKSGEPDKHLHKPDVTVAMSGEDWAKLHLSQATPEDMIENGDIQEEVETYLDAVPGVTLITIARVSVDPTSAIGILLATDKELPAGLKEELTSLVQKARGGSPTVRIIALLEVGEKQATRKP